jgi:hypothetical protein
MKFFKPNNIIVFFSITIFVGSLTQKCYCTTMSCNNSMMILFTGAIGFLYGGAALTWLANPLLLISWLTSNRNPKLSLVSSIFAMLLSASFLHFKKIISDEGGNYKQIISYQLGYWLWLASILTMVINNCIRYVRQHNEISK